MKKKVFCIAFCLFLAGLAADSSARDLYKTRREKANIVQAIDYLKIARSEINDLYDAPPKMNIERAEPYINQLEELEKQEDLKHLKKVREYLKAAKRYYKNHKRLAKYLDLAIAEMKQIKGGKPKGPNRFKEGRDRLNARDEAFHHKYRGLYEARDDLLKASRSKDPRVIASRVRTAKREVSRYSGSADGKIEKAIEYMDIALDNCRKPGKAKFARNRIGRAKGRISSAISYLKRQERRR